MASICGEAFQPGNFSLQKYFSTKACMKISHSSCAAGNLCPTHLVNAVGGHHCAVHLLSTAGGGFCLTQWAGTVGGHLCPAQPVIALQERIMVIAELFSLQTLCFQMEEFVSLAR